MTATGISTDGQIPIMNDLTSRICGQPAAHGELCQNHTTSWFEGHGWRCRFHMPEGHHWPHERRVRDQPVTQENAPVPPERPDPMPNDGRLETMEDAKQMIAWATREMGLGRITESQCRGVCNGAQRFIIAVDKTDGFKLGKEIRDGLAAAGFLKKGS